MLFMAWDGHVRYAKGRSGPVRTQGGVPHCVPHCVLACVPHCVLACVPHCVPWGMQEAAGGADNDSGHQNYELIHQLMAG